MALSAMRGWLTPSYTLAAVLAACSRLLNLFAEVIESGDEPEVGYLRGSPGLSAPLVTGGLPSAGSTGPFGLRGLLAAGTLLDPLSGANGVMYAVAGSKLFQVFANGTFTLLGDVGNDGLPVTMIPNGNQLGLVSNGFFWCDSGSGPVAIAYAPFQYTDISVGWGGTCDLIHHTGGGHIAFANGIVNLLSGIPFNAGMVGLPITIGANTYTVFGVINPNQLLLTTNPATALGQTFTAGLNTMIQSASAPFGAGDVGNSLIFQADGIFTGIGTTIASVDAYGNATLLDSPAPLGSTNGNALEIFTPFPAAYLTFLDSFFIVSPPGSKQIQTSAPDDGSTWDPTDNAFKESYPDDIGGLLADHQELLVMGESKSEVWQAPAANPIFPFQPNESLAMNIGIAAPASLCSFRDGPAWISASLRGQPIAVFAQGFQPQRISTHAIEQVWKSYTQVSDAVGFIYEMDGHELWQISFPSAYQTTPGDGLGATWVYDRTASLQMGKAMWHERNSFDGTVFRRHRANCHCYVFGKHWVGDFANGNIYEMSSTVYTDNGQPITCQRTMPHIDSNRLRQFFSYLQLNLETGSVALTVLLEWSDDGGTTWVGGGSNYTYVTKTTTAMDRASFWQLGSADTRVFRITVTGNGPKALVAAYLDYLVGTS